MTEKKKLYILTGAIVFICVVILSLNFILNNIDSSKIDDSEPEELTQNTEVIQNPFENLSEIDKYNESLSNNDILQNADSKNENKIINNNENIEKKSTFNIPKAKNNATLVFIFDDAGQNTESLKRYFELKFPFAVAILPGLVKTSECADLVRQNKRELILHQPMQAENLGLSPGPNAITAMMNTKDIAETVSKNIAELGKDVKGINNHEGSLITSNIIKIGAVLEVCDKKDLYFIDSRTTTKTKANQAALELGINIMERTAPFLDNIVSREQILSRIYESLEYSNKNGNAIIIGHVDKSANVLPILLSEMYPYLVEAGYKFALPSEIWNK